LAPTRAVWVTGGYQLVFERPEGESEGGAGLEDLREEGATVLGLQVVVGVQGSLEDGRPHLGLLGLSCSRRHDDVDRINLVDLELHVGDSVVCGFFVDDHVVSVEQESVQFVAQDSLESAGSEVFAHLGGVGGDLMVEVACFDRPDCQLESVPGSEDDIGLLSGDLVFADDDRVGQQGSEAVKVDSQVTAHSKPTSSQRLLRPEQSGHQPSARNGRTLRLLKCRRGKRLPCRSSFR